MSSIGSEVNSITFSLTSEWIVWLMLAAAAAWKSYDCSACKSSAPHLVLQFISSQLHLKLTRNSQSKRKPFSFFLSFANSTHRDVFGCELSAILLNIKAFLSFQSLHFVPLNYGDSIKCLRLDCLIESLSFTWIGFLLFFGDQKYRKHFNSRGWSQSRCSVRMQKWK